jgi:hypothetical protein
VAEYGRSEGQSITGGHVYRGARVPSLVGDYVYADYASGKFWALDYDGKKGTPRELVDTELNPSTFGVDAARELYFLDHSSGGVYRFEPK